MIIQDLLRDRLSYDEDAHGGQNGGLNVTIPAKHTNDSFMHFAVRICGSTNKTLVR